MEIIFRVQDMEGRGPYRPGFSHKWTDENHHDRCPPFFNDFGWETSDVPKKFQPGENGGCGFRTLEQAGKWFSPVERERLEAFGYYVTSMYADRVVAESEKQIVFARQKPLSEKVFFLPWGALNG